MSTYPDEPVTASPPPPDVRNDLSVDTPAPRHSRADDVAAALPIGKRTRVSTAWVGVVVAAVLLVLLLVFILQNGSKVPVKFLWMTGHLPLGVALLFSAVGGVLLAAAITGARVVQLRLAAHRVEKAAR